MIQDWAWIKLGSASSQEHDKLRIGILQPLILRLSRIFELSFHPYIFRDVFIPNDVEQLIFILFKIFIIFTWRFALLNLIK